MVQVEANQYIPFPLEEVSLDFCVVGPSAASAADVEVLIAAARREKVQDLQALAESVGLDPVTVDVESYAARRAAWAAIQSVPFNGDPPMVALLELGSTTSSLQVLRQGEVVFERDQAFGGAALTQAIAQQYGFSPEDAEARKRKGDLPDTYATEVLPAFLDSLAQDVARALKYFFTSTPYHRVDQILLAGGCATLPGLPQALSHWVQTPAAVLNPFAGMASGAGLSTSMGTALGSNPLHQRQAPSFLTACGLAMRRAA
jgi:type IV pilus assembly protein PilM